MNKRQKLVLEQFLGNEEAVIRRLKQVYAQSLKDVQQKAKALQDDINRLGALAGMEEDADEKARLLSMQQSKVYQKQYQDALKKQIGSILDNMQVEEFRAVSDYLQKCYEDGFVGAMFDLHGQGIPLILPIDQEAVVRAVQTDSKISKGLYTRLGEDVDELKKKITAQVSRGISTGMSYQDIARQLESYTNIGYNNAVRIARTEGHRIQVQSGMDACYKAKDKGADVVKQWDATLDGSTRKSHRKVDGEIREMDEKFSNGLRYPGDPAGGASEVVNCRCALLQRARWALDEDELQTIQDRADFFGLDKEDDFDEFRGKYLKAAEAQKPVQAKTGAGDGVVDVSVFPDYFRKSAAGKKATKTFVEALNNAERLDPNIHQLYTSIGDLGNLPDDLQITYTGKGHALTTWTRGGNLARAKLSVPKMIGDDLAGQKATAFHEIAHLIDLGTGKNAEYSSAMSKRLSEAIKVVGRDIPDDIQAMMDDFATEYHKIRDSLRATYKAKRQELTDAYYDGALAYSDYKKRWSALIREEEAERDYQSRNIMGGGVSMLSDIFDALSGGEYRDKGKLLYGHGGRYYRRSGAAEAEIFANYMSLSVNRPDIVDTLRKEKPELCSALDDLIKEMAGDKS